ncbi:MAG TPA: tRNA (adenosine(37)-N6)-dimethylallyltransferase MiaA [Patescibacteria group bacterium]|nr:tRNA (adenosine(37)-N6)-dimethylallyltransferase MiaA [Patescibacteria group bacterium]
MQKLLVICGPTSTGKTSLAIKLSKKFNGEIISADSRQVYRNLDIGTGKDLPAGAKIKYPFFSKYGFYIIDGTRVWGYDLADPKEEFNISWYLKFAHKIISDIQKRGKLPILTGGTGLYIKGVLYGMPTIDVPKNEKLRQELEKRNAGELYENLSQLDSLKAASLNSSDYKNPRRLIRAIEIAQWNLSHGKTNNVTKKLSDKNSILQIGLTAPIDFINKKINIRVKQRIDGGIKKEVENLIKSGVNWEAQSMASIGYRQWKDYFEGTIQEKQIIQEWEKEERKYAKRQMTWFKKIDGINWFDITNKNFLKKVENLAQKWYSSENVP